MDKNSPLTLEQQQRAAALERAKSLLSGYQQPIDPEALHSLAAWIVEPEEGRRRLARMFRDVTGIPREIDEMPEGGDQ